MVITCVSTAAGSLQGDNVRLRCRRITPGQERAPDPRQRDAELQHPGAAGRQRVAPDRRQVRPHAAADPRRGTVDVRMGAEL